MPKPFARFARGLSLDTIAVILALSAALLIRLNLIPPVKW
jgi:hypothetical protein